LKPSVEIESDEAFLTKLPIDIIREDKSVLDKPTIIGMNSSDGSFQTEYYYNKLAKTAKDIVRFVPMSINVKPDSRKAHDVAKEMEKFFFHKMGLSVDTIQGFNDIGTDCLTTIPTALFNELYRKYSPQCKQYAYMFDLDTKLNIFKSISNLKNLVNIL